MVASPMKQIACADPSARASRLNCGEPCLMGPECEPCPSGRLRTTRAKRILQFQSIEIRFRKIAMNSHTRNLGIVSATALMAAFAFAVPAAAQSQEESSQSVAEAARKAKERKKTTTKDSPVITDDTIHLRAA